MLIVTFHRNTCVGLRIKFIKSNTLRCINCKYVKERLFSKKYKCEIILGLDLEDGELGYCNMYESSK